MSQYTERKFKTDKKSSVCFQQKNLLMKQVGSASIESMKSIIKNLQEMVRQEKQKRQFIEQKFLDYRDRALQREKEFYKIVEKLSIDKKQFTNTNQELDRLYQQILNNFDLSNTKTNAYLQEKYKNLQHTMNRRIGTIIQNSAKAIHKNYQISKQTTLQIKKQIKDIMEMAHVVEQNSYSVQKNIKNLQFDNRMLKEQKNLLLQENITKKKVILELSKQIKTLKDKIHLLENELIGNNAQNEKNKMAKSSKIIGSRNLWKKKQSKNNSNVCAQIELEYTAADLQSYFVDKRTKSGLSTPRNKTNVFSTPTNKESNKMGKANKTIDNVRKRRKSAQTGRPKSSSALGPNTTTVSICPYCHNNPQKTEKNQQIPNSTIYSYNKTINHLQNVVKREKQKALAMGNEMTKMMMKSKQINDTLGQILLANKDKNPEEQLKILLESQKMLQTIRGLKRRLTMLQQPSIGSGWGQTFEDI